MSASFEDLCTAEAGRTEVLQGNIAFAAGCVRGGVHAADGYPGTPSSEVIDRGLALVQDRIKVGWSTNEAVAAAVSHGHTMAGEDCVVTMKIPGLFQAADIFTSGALFHHPRGTLVWYIASDYTPSSTQHTIDPRYLFKSSFTPVFEPRTHQELHESAALAVEIGRRYNTQVVILPAGNLCHSEGLVRLMPQQHRDPVQMTGDMKKFMVLPGIARQNYDHVLPERMPALAEMVETSPLNTWTRGSGQIGVITCGMCDMYVRQVQRSFGVDLDILSLGWTNPLPLNRIREFCAAIDGPVYVIEDGYRFLQESVEALGLKVCGKDPYSTLTEWSPRQIAERLGLVLPKPVPAPAVTPPARPPMICAGCPYRLIAGEISLLKKKKQVDAVFGDIGCNTLLYFMNALDTSLAMGASEAQRAGYVLSRPEEAARVISLLGDSTECHSGMDSTRNTIYRNVPGVKIILDNSWTGMTGGQPSPTSPANLAGQPIGFDLPESLRAHGANVVTVAAYNKKAIREALKTALDGAAKGVFTTIVVREGSCIQKLSPSSQRVLVDPALCKKCNVCLICPGLELDENGIPRANNLCTGCAGSTPACVQMCAFGALQPADRSALGGSARPVLAAPPKLNLPALDPARIPAQLSLAIRGVGGQGNLFFGTVLTRLALLAGYDRRSIIKGDTHGMAQMGGPVISTFTCGEVGSPVLLPGTADCLIAMEKGEVLRPGFLEMLKPGGTVLLAATRILPASFKESQYPAEDQILAALEGYHVLQADVLGKALELGDTTGRSANVVMLGLLSTQPMFDHFPPELWLEALRQAGPKPAVWSANYAAFNAGRQMAAVQA